jgi:Mrp family chromosome partitioning ATPase
MADSAAGFSSSRAEWLGARAALAVRRSGRFAIGAAVTFIVVLVALLFVPQLGGPAPLDIAVHVVRADTAQLVGALTDARSASARADAIYEAILTRADSDATGPIARVVPGQSERDSLGALASQLDTLLDRATKAPLPASYRSLAGARALRGDTHARRLDDSLAVLERKRGTLDPTSGAERAFADLAGRVNEVGRALRDIASRRRAGIENEIVARDAVENRTHVTDIDTAGSRAMRDSARMRVARADSALATARASNALADRKATAARERASRRVPPVAMLAAAAVLAVIIGFSMSLFAEIGRPTVATSPEAERAAEAPVLAIVRDRDRATRALDPFHLLYLGLTARGTRVRTIAIGGSDRAVVATVSGRLARAAAADERATLVVDMDADASPVAGYYLERPEPGLTDVMAGVRSWREVTRPVGASDGLAIDVVPAGSIRRGVPDAAAVRAARKEFAAFRAEYDLCIVVAPSVAARERLTALVEKPVVILCAEVARTTLALMRKSATEWRDAGAIVHGVTLWDGELPYITSRNELMAKALRLRTRITTPSATSGTV